MSQKYLVTAVSIRVQVFSSWIYIFIVKCLMLEITQTGAHNNIIPLQKWCSCNHWPFFIERFDDPRSGKFSSELPKCIISLRKLKTIGICLYWSFRFFCRHISKLRATSDRIQCEDIYDGNRGEGKESSLEIASY